jgi:hypothetical protein
MIYVSRVYTTKQIITEWVLGGKTPEFVAEPEVTVV